MSVTRLRFDHQIVVLRHDLKERVSRTNHRANRVDARLMFWTSPSRGALISFRRSTFSAMFKRSRRSWSFWRASRIWVETSS